jgi:hypothetical protein
MRVFITVAGHDDTVQDLLTFLETDAVVNGYTCEVSREDLELEMDESKLVETVNELRKERAEQFNTVDPAHFNPLPPTSGDWDEDEKDDLPSNEERLLSIVGSKLGDLKNLQHLRKGRETMREIRDAIGLLGLLYAFELQQKYPDKAEEFVKWLPYPYRASMNRAKTIPPDYDVPEDYEGVVLDDEA